MQKYFGGATAAEVGRQFNRIDADDDRKLTWSEMLQPPASRTTA